VTVFTDFADIPLLHYGVIAVDPPWHYETYSHKAMRSASAHYETMSIDDICALPVGHIASRDAVLMLWGTSPHLPAALEVIKAWGFTYKSKAFCWAKTNPRTLKGRADVSSTWHMGMGYGTRSNTEDCWLATTGEPKRLDAGIRELIVAERREHSRKPDEFFQRAQLIYPGPRIELFAREERHGWDVFGDQVGVFDESR